MKNMSTICVSALTFSLLASGTSHADTTQIIYGLDAACNFHSAKQGPFLVQAGEFKSKSNARHFKDTVPASTNAPVNIRSHHANFSVVIGPLQSASAVRDVGCSRKSSISKHHQKATHSSKKQAVSLHTQPVADISDVSHVPSATLHTLSGFSSDAFNRLGRHLGHLELSGALGGSWHQAHNSSLQVTDDERDTDVVSGASSNIFYSAGIGYHAFSKELEQRQFLTGLLVQLNYYYSASTVNGDVWAYQSPNANNFTFKAPMHTSRLMLDLKPELFVYKGFTPYGVLGAGAAWSEMSYAETAKGDTPSIGAARLNSHLNTTVAYDLGIGVSRPITDNLNVAIEYLYSSLGTLLPSVNSNSLQPIVGAPGFSMQSQTVMARLSWKSKQA